MTIAVNRNLSNHILISFVSPQFTSFHSVFHSFHGLMNSINWPASSVWVFIAQLGEHCSANAEATGSSPVEAPKKLFFGLFSQLLKLRFTAMVTYSFHSKCYLFWTLNAKLSCQKVNQYFLRVLLVVSCLWDARKL